MARVKQPVWFVMKHPNGWQVKRRGSSRASAVKKTKKAALRKAKRLARKNNGQVRVKNQDGRFAFERTYGNDPRSSKG